MRIRWMILILIGLTTVSIAQNNNDKKLYLKTSNYFMDIKVDFDNNIIISTCKITVTNPTNERAETIPILLYRLMNVTSIKDNKGNPLSFTQQILSFEDWKVFQANYIEIQLDEPILVGESKEIVIEYSGVFVRIFRNRDEIFTG